MNRAMLILLGSLAALGLVVVAAGTAGAAAAAYSNYHQGTTMVCNDCHTMHGTLQHNYSSAVSGATYTNTYRLLKGASAAADVTAFCLSCHDGNGGTYPDVLGGTSQTSPRAAGALNDASTAGSYENYMGHTLGVSAAAPGGGPTLALTCTSCHAQHGTTSYRNLHTTDIAGGGSFNGKAVAGRQVTGLGGSVTITGLSANVLIETTGTRPAYSAAAAFYDTNKIYYTSDSNAYASWCGGCHPNFVATATAGKHPTGTNVGTSTSSKTAYGNAGTKVPVLASALTGTRNPGTGFYVADTAGTIQPSCVSCHKSHGNQNAFGLLYVVSGTALNENGGSTTAGVQATCQVCHQQGQ